MRTMSPLQRAHGSHRVIERSKRLIEIGAAGSFCGLAVNYIPKVNDALQPRLVRAEGSDRRVGLAGRAGVVLGAVIGVPVRLHVYAVCSGLRLPQHSRHASAHCMHGRMHRIPKGGQARMRAHGG